MTNKLKIFHVLRIDSKSRGYAQTWQGKISQPCIVTISLSEIVPEF